jgi:hypothetical protein
VATEKPRRTIGIYLLLAWMVGNVAIFLLLIPGDSTDINNYVELVLWVGSAAGLLTMKKAGAALAVAVLCVTLGTSMGIVLLAYYNGLMMEPVAYINALRIVVNAVGAAYLFKLIFANKFT